MARPSAAALVAIWLGAVDLAGAANLAGASRSTAAGLRGGSALSVGDEPNDAPPLPPRRGFSPRASQVGATAGLALGWAFVKRKGTEEYVTRPRTAEAWRKMNKRKRAIIPLGERAPAIIAVALACGLTLDYCAQARVYGMRGAFAHTDLATAVGGTWNFAATQTARAVAVPQALFVRATRQSSVCSTVE